MYFMKRGNQINNNKYTNKINAQCIYSTVSSGSHALVVTKTQQDVVVAYHCLLMLLLVVVVYFACLHYCYCLILMFHDLK